MPSTTHPDFNEQTTGLEVAASFTSRIRGKTVLVTGANPGGIGFSTAEAFASQSPANIILAGRSLPRLQESITALTTSYPSVTYLPLVVDLSSQSSVRAAASTVLSWDNVLAIDITINSAGVMLLPERTLSPDGVEMHFATNHLGHFLLTCLLLPKLIAAAKANPNHPGSVRVVNVASGSPMQTSAIRWSDVNFTKTNKDLPEDKQPNYHVLKAWGVKQPEEKSYTGLEGYNQSKVANVLFSVGLTRRVFNKYGILSLAVHPGVIQTELGRHVDGETRAALDELFKNGVYKMKSLGAGAATSLVAALDPGLAEGEVGREREGRENYGVYLADCQVCDKALPGATSGERAERLWAMSEGLVGKKFEF
ncbi:putative short-chain dehydrogenase [Coniochaeta sp. 2T2.1]|nr:putative short-chain dehydrogenase [Coniochaeta sp. 2T2.1]